MSQAKVTQALATLLADSYTLYLKTHNFHWNVTGPQFASLHTLFEQQYTELALAVDVIAERIRALGAFAPGSYQEFAELTGIQEARGSDQGLSASDMIKQLVHDQEVVIASAQKVQEAASDVRDEPTADLAVQRLTEHQKNRWMLSALVE